MLVAAAVEKMCGFEDLRHADFSSESPRIQAY